MTSIRNIYNNSYTFFCIMNNGSMILLQLFPHISKQYDRYGKNKELYNINSASLFNLCLTLYIIALHFDNLLLTFDM